MMRERYVDGADGDAEYRRVDADVSLDDAWTREAEQDAGGRLLRRVSEDARERDATRANATRCARALRYTSTSDQEYASRRERRSRKTLAKGARERISREALRRKSPAPRKRSPAPA